MVALVACLSLAKGGCVIGTASPGDDAYSAARDAYRRGEHEAAFGTFLDLATRGHPRAQYQVGWLYANGRGVPQDFQEAVRWYRQAAEQGHPAGQWALGRRYVRGEGVEQDLAEALAQAWLEAWRARFR